MISDLMPKSPIWNCLNLCINWNDTQFLEVYVFLKQLPHLLSRFFQPAAYVTTPAVNTAIENILMCLMRIMNEADGNGILAAPSETHLLFCVKHICFLEKPWRLVLMWLTLILSFSFSLCFQFNSQNLSLPKKSVMFSYSKLTAFEKNLAEWGAHKWPTTHIVNLLDERILYLILLYKESSYLSKPFTSAVRVWLKPWLLSKFDHSHHPWYCVIGTSFNRFCSCLTDVFDSFASYPFVIYRPCQHFP